MSQDGTPAGAAPADPAQPPQALPWGRPPRKPAQQPFPPAQQQVPLDQQPVPPGPGPIAPAEPAPPVPQPAATAPWTGGPVSPAPQAAQPTLAFSPEALTPLPAPGRSSGGGRAVLVGLLVGLLVLAAGGGAAWLFLGGDDSEGSTTAASSTTERSRPAPTTEAERPDRGNGSTSSSPGRTTSAPAPRVDPEVQAVTELERLRAASLPRLSLDGRWVAQVASKAVGITDPMQTTASGSHTFTAVDILAESMAARRLADPSSVLVLQSTDFGKVSRWTNGQPFWVTVVDAGFGSSDQVTAWCDRAFAGLTPEQRANTCAPRTLAAPHD